MTDLGGYSVEAWFGIDFDPHTGDTWRWWMDLHNLDEAVTEQRRMEYYHGTPARVVRRVSKISSVDRARIGAAMKGDGG